MIRPERMKYKGKRKLNENYRFRIFLKNNAEEYELDQQFKELHEELFVNYDCSQCRNCCKDFFGMIPFEDISKDAKYLNMSEETFKSVFLDEETREGYFTKHRPCDFFDKKTNSCILGDCKPVGCKEYPHTNKPNRLSSMLGIVEASAICPVVYEMLERLKKEYDFI